MLQVTEKSPACSNGVLRGHTLQEECYGDKPGAILEYMSLCLLIRQAQATLQNVLRDHCASAPLREPFWRVSRSDSEICELDLSVLEVFPDSGKNRPGEFLLVLGIAQLFFLGRV